MTDTPKEALNTVETDVEVATPGIIEHLESFGKWTEEEAAEAIEYIESLFISKALSNATPIDLSLAQTETPAI